MQEKNLIFIIIFLLISTVLTNASTVRLNEIVASNSSTISDEDGDYEDWIELYNYGNSSVNLSGYYLSDDYDELDMWQFPDVSISPGDYLLVWASNKNRKTGELHTNFAISSAGEEVLLVNSNGDIIDELSPRYIPNDISVGRVGSDNSTWHYFGEPTPNRENTTTSYRGIAQPPQFSRNGGIHSSAFELNLSTNESGATIYYTTDGSVPEAGNLNGSSFDYSRDGRHNSTIRQRSYRTHQYSSSISVENKTGREDPLHEISTRWDATAVSPREDPLTGTVVRARVYRDGYLPSDIVSHSYIIRNSGYSVPVISLILPEKSLFEYNTGIHVPGVTYDNWRNEGSPGGLRGTSPANFNNRGREWERETNIEFFTPSGDLAFNQKAGLRIHGGWSRSFPQKSLRLYARGGYGEGEFKHQLFPNKDTDVFKRFLLRASGNDYDLTFFRDAMIQQMVRNRPIDMQHWEPSVTFVNGEYWGILNIRDRVDRYYLHYKYGVDPDNLDILEGDSMVKEGDSLHYARMLEYVESNDMTNSDHFSYVKTLMDVENYAEHYAINIFVNNQDWPGNNIDYWRVKTDEYKPDAPYGHDGRWRWFLFDTDFGFGIWYSGSNTNTLRHATGEQWHEHGNPDWSTVLFKNLLDNSEFRHILINRFADLMNTSFDSDSVLMMIDAMKQRYEPIIDDHIDRWNRIDSRYSWDEQIDIMKDFARERPSNVRSHIESYFGLSGDSRITVNPGTGNGTVRINTIKFRNSQGWEGRYFRDVPIEVEAIPDINYKFSHWEGEYSSQEELLEVILSGSIELTAHFVEDRENPMIHYWHFNDLSSDDNLDNIRADFSANSTGRINYEGSSEGYMDRVGGNLNNYRFNNPAGYGLRVRNPSQNRALIIDAPTTGFEHIVFSYAVRRTSNGSQRQRVSYSPDGGSTWNVLGDNIRVNEDYEVRVFDLREISEINNNSQLQFRIEFTGENAPLESGNNRFDNIAIEMLDPSIPVVDIITAVEETKSENWQVSLGPNPINETLVINIDNPNLYHIGETVGVTIRDLRGRVRVVCEVLIDEIGDNLSSDIDVSSLESGVYIVDLHINGQEVRRMNFAKISKD